MPPEEELGAKVAELGEELEAKVAELKEQGLNSIQIAEAIYSEDINAPTGGLMRLLNLKAYDIGRIKGIIKRKEKALEKPGGVGAPPSGKAPSEEARPEEAEPTVISDFRTALNDNITRKEARRFIDSLVSKFSKRFHQLLTTPQNLQTWLMNMGCSSSEANCIAEDMFTTAQAGQGYGGQQQAYAQVLNPQTGQVQTFPIIMLQSPAQPQPNILTIEKGQPQPSPLPFYIPSPTQPDRETQNRLDRVERALADLADRITSPPPAAPTPSHLVRRLPISDADGTILTDKKGNILYQEVPYDPAMSVFEMMRDMGTFGGKEKPFDEEKFGLKTREMIREAMDKVAPKGETDTDKIRSLLREETDKITTRVDHFSQRLEGIEKREELEEAITKAVTPLQDRLDKIQVRSGLSDEQFKLTHRETLVNLWHTFMSGVINSVRQDLRPAVIQAAVSGMKQAGMSDQTIQSVVQSLATPSTEMIGGELTGRIAAARQKWLHK